MDNVAFQIRLDPDSSKTSDWLYDFPAIVCKIQVGTNPKCNTTHGHGELQYTQTYRLCDLCGGHCAGEEGSCEMCAPSVKTDRSFQL